MHLLQMHCEYKFSIKFNLNIMIFPFHIKLSHFHFAVDQRAASLFFPLSLSLSLTFVHLSGSFVCRRFLHIICFLLYMELYWTWVFFLYVLDDADSNDSCCMPRGKSQSPEPCHPDERPTNLHLVSLTFFYLLLFICLIQEFIVLSINFKFIKYNEKNFIPLK